MPQINITSNSSWLTPLVIAGRDHVTDVDILPLRHWGTLVSANTTVLLSMLILLTGILCNVFLGLYVTEKMKRSSGIRTLLCNQIFANLVALFSYLFVPLQVIDDYPPWNIKRLCKVVPSMSFLAISVSITNLAAILMSYYRAKKSGKFAHSSIWSSWIVVVGSWLVAAALTVPLAMSLQIVDVRANTTRASMCVSVWDQDRSRDIFMSCTLIVKFAAPVLLMIALCVKLELLRIKARNKQRCRKICNVLVNILTAIILLLLIYFFPLGYLGKGKFFRPSPATAFAADILHFFELVALANCSTVPLILTALVDSYGRDTSEHNYFQKSDIDTQDAPLELPGSNMNTMTYDILLADMPEKWRPSPSRVLIV